jgi:hypothetical protein
VTSQVPGFPADQWGVEVVVGPVESSLVHPTRDEGFMQMAPGEFLGIVDGVGRVHVTSERVTIDTDPGHSVTELDYVIYGWAPRWIRILREEFTLHASGVVAGDRAIAVMGVSGAGKSTTVTALTRRGYPLIVDDVLPVDVPGDDALPTVSGWARPVHLTDEAAAHFGVDDVSRVGTRQESKIAADLPSIDGVWQLTHAIELWKDDDAVAVTSRRLSGAEKLQAILTNANSSGMEASDGRQHSFFAWATTLAQRIDVYRITRPSAGWHLDAAIDEIITIIES